MEEKRKANSDRYLTMQAMQRMPYYLDCLEKAEARGIQTISATSIAAELQLNDVLVRKDIAAVSTKRGKPKAGFAVPELIADMKHYMGMNEIKDAVIAGAGSLGTALLCNSEFEKYGFRIKAAFDTDETLIGTEINGVPVYPAASLETYCRENSIPIGIITTPKTVAQKTADMFIRGGVRAIWNFALLILDVPEGIHVQNENLASSLAVLSRFALQ